MITATNPAATFITIIGTHKSSALGAHMPLSSRHIPNCGPHFLGFS